MNTTGKNPNIDETNPTEIKIILKDLIKNFSFKNGSFQYNFTLKKKYHQ
jgi:hypothetical protein